MTGSTSDKPDLDWSQVRETVRMMNLAVAQITMSMREGDDSIDTLTHAFTSMMAKVNYIEQQAKNSDSELSENVVDECEAVSSEMQHAIIAFQFYDKLSQRLDHVSYTLGLLSDLVADGGRLYNPREWASLQDQIRSKYSMPAEHKMFELVMQGMPISEILHQHNATEQAEDDSDIELF